MTSDARFGTLFGEFTKFAVVGLVSNGLLFLLYMLMTRAGLGHKIAATLAYVIGVLQTFVFNRNWSFRHTGAASASLGRYIATYAVGYVFNMLALLILVDYIGYPHLWVQGAVILALAVLLFLSQKFWVFRKAAGEQW